MGMPSLPHSKSDRYASPPQNGHGLSSSRMGLGLQGSGDFVVQCDRSGSGPLVKTSMDNPRDHHRLFVERFMPARCLILLTDDSNGFGVGVGALHVNA